MRKITFSLSILMVFAYQFAFASADFEKTGKHKGEVENLEYFIEYLEPKGITTADSYGITFKPFDFGWSFLPQILPVKYFGDYPLYFTGDILNFKVHLKNVGKRTFRNLKVFVFQEFLNPNGGKGGNIGDNNSADWFLSRLGHGEETILDGIFEIPLVGESGLDQTHLQILHYPNDASANDKGAGRIIIDDFQAGIWCPAAQ